VKFDYIIANPPYSSGTNRLLWKQIMDRLISFSTKISIIAPTGGLTGINNWKRYKNDIVIVEKINPIVFDVGVEISRIYIDKTNTVDSIKLTQLDINGEPETEIVPRDKLLYRVPRVKMKIDEYFQTFDQSKNGVKWEALNKIIPGQEPSGVWMVKKGVFEYCSSIRLFEQSNSGYIPTDKKMGIKLADRLTSLHSQGKIDGYWTMGYAHATIDLDPIRRELTTTKDTKDTNAI
jgi:hypothetical protein